MELNENYVYHAYLSKSFTKAANILYISQPSLSAAIASKEKELGFRIFDRSTKPISLTREGEIYIEMLEGKIRCENDMRLRQTSNRAENIFQAFFFVTYLHLVFILLYHVKE